MLQVAANPVETFLDYLTVECGLSVNTLQAYQRDLERFAAFVPRDRPRRLGRRPAGTRRRLHGGREGPQPGRGRASAGPWWPSACSSGSWPARASCPATSPSTSRARASGRTCPRSSTAARWTGCSRPPAPSATAGPGATRPSWRCSMPPAPGQRGGRPDPPERQPGGRVRPVRGQGPQGTHRARGPACPGGPGGVPRGRAAATRPPAGPAPFPDAFRPPHGPRDALAPGQEVRRPHRRQPARQPAHAAALVRHAPPGRAGRTSASSRRCWATSISGPRRSTRT